MTVIKSIFGKELGVDEGRRDLNEVTLSCSEDHDFTGAHVRVYPRADLLAALDAVPREDFVAIRDKWYHSIDADQHNDAVKALHAKIGQARLRGDGWRDKARAAEAKLAEAKRALTELAPERDERVIAWEAIARHEVLRPCYDEDRPLLNAVLDRLGALSDAEAKLDEAIADAVRWADELVDAQDESKSWKSRAEHAESVIGNYLRRIEGLTAERDAHAATIERVREVLADDESIHPLAVNYHGGFRFAIRSALNSAPVPFTLPTVAGVRFEAQGRDDKIGSLTGFVTLIGAGRPVYMAVNDVDCVYEAEQVMECFTGHRLIAEGDGE